MRPAGRQRERGAEPSLESVPAVRAEFVAFDGFRIDCAGRRLVLDGDRIRIQQKPLDVLIYLARNHSRVVPREELLERFWPRAVNEESLTRCISTIRRHLGDTREPPRYIETLWGMGYRFIGPVEPAPDRVVEGAAAPAAQPPGADGWARRRRLWPRWLAVAAAAAALVVGPIYLARTTSPLDTAEEPIGGAIQGLAVLPMIAGPGAEPWLAVALTDHLIETLYRFDGVRVVARGSTARFSADSDPREVGAQLGVDVALITSLEQSGHLTRLSAQLVSTRDGALLWRFSATPNSAGVDAMQVRQLAGSVAKRLWANLQVRGAERAVDPRAYQHYLSGRYYWSQRSSAALAAAIRSYEAALAIDSDYVDALLGLADAWLVLPQYIATPPKEAIPRARAAARRALEIDPAAAHALAVLGVVAMQYDWDWATAEAHLRQAVTLNPNDASAEQWLGEFYCYRQRPDDCRKHLHAAAGLDPLSPVLRMMAGSPALFSGDFETAAAAYAEAVEDVPEFPMSRYVLGLSQAGLGDWDAAIAGYEASLPDLGLPIVGGPMAYALARRGDTGRAEAVLEELGRLAETHYVPPTKIATAWLGLQDKARALEWLGRALDVRDDRLVYLAVDPHFRELHGDPEFRAYADRVGVLDVLRAGQ